MVSVNRDCPFLGRSCRWRFEPITSAMDSLPDVGHENLTEQQLFDFLCGGRMQYHAVLVPFND